MQQKLIAATLGLMTVTVLGAADPLAGRWSTGRISTIQYRDATTGAPAPTSGNNFAYEFRADGTYSFTGLMQNTMYNCTTAVFSNESGKYTIEGDRLELRPEKNPYRMTNSCAPSRNREAAGKIIERSYRFRIVNEDRARLELKSEADGAVSSFRKEE
jgi:hypothetical protein